MIYHSSTFPPPPQHQPPLSVDPVDVRDWDSASVDLKIVYHSQEPRC